MRQVLLKIAIVVIVVLLQACSPSLTQEGPLPTGMPILGTSTSPSLTPEILPPTGMPILETSAASALPYYPLDTMTGNEEIDVVLIAVATGDPQQVRDLFGYTSTTCMTVNALGGPPPCRPGEAEGTPVEVLPFLGPEGHFLRRDETDDFPGLHVIGIYAVYQVSDAAYSEGDYPAGDYGIMLVGEGGEPGYILQVREGMIVRLDYIFDPSSYNDWLQRDASGFILAPKQ